MPNIDPADYEALTVAELKEIADSLGVEIPHDARKAEIIELLAKGAKEEGLLETPPAEKEPAEKSGKNAYNYTMSSTVDEVQLDQEQFRKLKLTS